MNKRCNSTTSSLVHLVEPRLVLVQRQRLHRRGARVRREQPAPAEHRAPQHRNEALPQTLRQHRILATRERGVHAHVDVVRPDDHVALRLRRDAVRVEPGPRRLRSPRRVRPAPDGLHRRGSLRLRLPLLRALLLAFPDGVVGGRLGGAAAERVVGALIGSAALGARHLLGRDAGQVGVVDGVVLLVDRRHHLRGSALVQPHLELLHDLRHLLLEVGDRLVVAVHLRALDQAANVLLLRRQVLLQPRPLLRSLAEHLLDILGRVPVVLRGLDVGLRDVDVPELRELHPVLLQLRPPRPVFRVGHR
mmetsp:Transcript_7876/g.31918  ORF Transcript_7876/g.31918 Transcript_7876/m.31918 type:complete len:305 (+) Transcript_7876:41-955(+)